MKRLTWVLVLALLALAVDGPLVYAFRESDGLLIDKEIIVEGYGFAYVKYAFEKMAEFRKAERDAPKNIGCFVSKPPRPGYRCPRSSGIWFSSRSKGGTNHDKLHSQFGPDRSGLHAGDAA